MENKIEGQPKEEPNNEEIINLKKLEENLITINSKILELELELKDKKAFDPSIQNCTGDVKSIEKDFKEAKELKKEILVGFEPTAKHILEIHINQLKEIKKEILKIQEREKSFLNKEKIEQLETDQKIININMNTLISTIEIILDKDLKKIKIREKLEKFIDSKLNEKK